MSLDSFGGEVGLWARATETPDEEMPRIIEVIALNWAALTDRTRAGQFVIDHLAQTPSPNALGESVDALLDSSQAAEALGDRLASTLTARARDRSTERSSDLAARALEGAMRLVLAGFTPETHRFALLAELLRIDGQSALYGTRVARLLSIAYEQWQVAGARDALSELLTMPDVEGDAAFGLAMVELADALAATDADQLVAAFGRARVWLARAQAWEEERTDASLYLMAIDVVLGFATGRSGEQLKTQVEAMTSLLTGRHLDHLGMRPSWTGARLDAEQEWWRLVDLLAAAQEPIEQPSWIAPVEAAVQVLEAYRASRALRPAFGQPQEGVYQVVAPRFRSAFVERAGLRHHLAEAVRLSLLPEEAMTAARSLLAETDEPRSPPDPDPQLRYPTLLRAVGHDAGAQQISRLAADNSGVLDVLEEHLAERERQRAQIAIPDIELAQARISEWLQGCADYRGTGAMEIDELVLQLLHFLWTRMTLQQGTLGTRMSYLSEFALVAPPHEREMAQDLYEFLSPNIPRARPRLEVRDIAGGRVDILVSFAQNEYVIECKRELAPFSRDAIDAYLPQVAQYQANAGLVAFLAVLDLGRSGPMPIYRECVWEREVPAESDPELNRRVIVIRVPGNQVVPSSLR